MDNNLLRRTTLRLVRGNQSQGQSQQEEPMEPILSQALSQMFSAVGQTIASEIASQLSDPKKLEQTLASFFGGGCHDNVDVAQDALDAYQAGHLTKDQCLRIVKICLEERNPGKTIDIEALERLVVK